MENKLNLRYCNGTFDDIKDRQRNLWLGVSVSLKPYNEELAKLYVSFLTEYTKEDAIILIADDLAAINYKVLNGHSWGTSLKKARKDGDKQQNFYERIISCLSEEERKKIRILRWKNIVDEDLESKIQILKEEYNLNFEFQKEVHIPIIDYLESTKKTITDKRLNRLSIYILSELPIILDGVYNHGKRYSAMLYPTFSGSSLDKLSYNIQNEINFPHLKERLGVIGDHILIDAVIPRE